ncbi:MAG: glycosyltransferase [Pseudomonadota bacterium]|nr:glycosyltransferase [Pseudomonadota bacterium]
MDTQEVVSTRAGRPLRACMLAYTFYENDGRVLRYAEALANDGAQVDAIVLRRTGQSSLDSINGVRVLRIQERQKNEPNKWVYLARVLRFFFRSMFEITRRHIESPYDIIHVHSVPDFEIFAAIIPKILGAKLVLDIHDIVPEFYAAKFKVSEQSIVFSVLKLVERASAGFANHVIVANDLWLKKIAERSSRPAKCSAMINFPDASIFDPALRDRPADDRFVVMYPGTLSWHQGLDLAVAALSHIATRAPRMELHIYGEGPAKDALAAQIVELGLQDRVFLRAPLPIREIAKVMANADLGVVPKRNDAFGGDAFSTKTLEFMSLRVPLVVASTRVDRFYFTDALVRFFEPDSVEDLAAVLLEAYTNPAQNAARAARALEFAGENSWSRKKSEYMDIVGRLVNG